MVPEARGRRRRRRRTGRAPPSDQVTDDGAERAALPPAPEREAAPLMTLRIPREVIEEIIRDVTSRNDALMRGAPPCPFCTSSQVQLMARTPPASWRCRTCKHVFDFEPLEKM